MFEISRRDLVLGAASAYALFGIDKPINFIGAARAEETATRPFRKYKVGDIEIFSLIDGYHLFPLRAGFVKNVDFDQVKAAMRAAGIPENRIPIGFAVMALKLNDQLVLIELGHGRAPNLRQGKWPAFRKHGGCRP